MMKRVSRSLKSIVLAGCFAGIMIGFPKQTGAEISLEAQENYSELVRTKYHDIMLRMQEGLEDNLLDEDEQMKINSDYYFLKELRDGFCPDIDPTGGSEIYRQVDRYAQLIEKNIDGFDLGQPEVEKELHQKGLSEVKVEGITSNKESMAYGITALLGVVGYLISYVKRKSKV